METTRFKNGAFVFSRIRGLEPRDPSELIPVAEQHGISPKIIPEYPGDRAAFVRSLGQASRGLSKQGYLVRPIKRANNEVVYGIVKEQKDEGSKRLDHEFESTITWQKEPDPSIVQGNHPVALDVAAAYEQLRGKIIADDWSSSITSYLESHDSARMRGDGRVYWVPPQKLDKIRQFGVFLQAVGIDLILCEIEPENQTVVHEVAHASIDEEIERLQQEVDGFDGTQNAATYARRLEEYQALRERAILYRDALGIGASRASDAIGALETKVKDMLTLRKQLVIPRGQKDNILEFPKPKNDMKLIFAGETFSLAKNQETGFLRFVADGENAKKSVSSLEAMSLTGKWHQAGPVMVAIQNSGPPGEAVSIRFQPADLKTIKKSAPALRPWGIELS